MSGKGGQGVYSIKEAFTRKGLNNPDNISYIAVWMDLGKIQIWGTSGNGLLTEITPLPEQFEQTLDALVQKLQSQGIDLMQLDRGTNSLNQDASNEYDYKFFYRPEHIEYFEYTTKSGVREHSPAIAIEGIPFYMDEQAADCFIHELKSRSTGDGEDWLEFSNSPSAEFKCSTGKYGFRKSLIIDMFANTQDHVLAIQSRDLYRVFVPMENPAQIIDPIAQKLPHLVKSDAPATAYPLYFDPSYYPEHRRHHINIIMRA
ncbi:MAG: hypothetical protein AUJ12_04015 [Alphaproteobacteria bacterium CG1_02_46_17]|nr:MAG: hypothetical protein AUJ12_04015 [Alphaproteobacteria bacterium CG1_02_46_17]